MPVDLTVMRGQEAGYLAKDVAGAADVSLSNAEAGEAVHVYSGALTANIDVIFPLTAENKGFLYLLENATTEAFTLTVKGLAGTGLAITQGSAVIAVWTGADFVAWAAELARA